jgi:hypothetical protein
MVTSRQEKRLEAQRKIISHFEEKIPYFTDIFDERTFYICFGCLVAVCIILVIVLSVCCKVTIQDADELNRQKEERKRLKQKKLAEKMLRKKLEKLSKDPNSTEDKIKLEKLLKKLTELDETQKDNEDIFKDN